MTPTDPLHLMYEPTLPSVKRHTVPQWFHDAKFGIFIHWTIASIPAFAPVERRNIVEIIQQGGWEEQYKNNPYVEWYLNSLRIKDSPVSRYHAQKYGENYSYDNFAPAFNALIGKWDPEKWADTFKRIGAKYVVLVTKHHDGFLLWPSTFPNPRKQNWQVNRDIVGELTAAVKSKGLKMGLYYSGALDWSFTASPITDTAGLIVNGPTQQEYADYVNAHYRELVDRYEPAILWNDIGYPPGTNLYDLISYYYNKIPEGVINDRWLQVPKKGRWAYTVWPVRNLLEWLMKRATVKYGIRPPAPPHSDYATPEYTTLSGISKRKWECVRGIGKSFGYNQAEKPDDYLAAPDLIRMLIDIVSKNGNFLLNIGPMSDGTLPEVQLDRVEGMGRWLKVNGEAIYETRPWITAGGKTSCGIDIRYTKKPGRLYAILMDTPAKAEILIKDLRIPQNAVIHLLGSPGNLHWKQAEENLWISLPAQLPMQPAHALMISPF